MIFGCPVFPGCQISIGALPGIGLASQAKDFYGADDASRVLSVNAVIGGWIHLFEFFQQLFEWSLFKFCSQLRIGGWRFSESFEIGAEIESGAPTEDRRLASFLDVQYCFPRQLDEVRDAEGLGEWNDADEVVRDEIQFFRSGFGGSDVDLFVHLHRVERDDFSIQFLSQLDGGR